MVKNQNTGSSYISLLRNVEMKTKSTNQIFLKKLLVQYASRFVCQFSTTIFGYTLFFSSNFAQTHAQTHFLQGTFCI